MHKWHLVMTCPMLGHCSYEKQDGKPIKWTCDEEMAYLHFYREDMLVRNVVTTQLRNFYAVTRKDYRLAQYRL